MVEISEDAAWLLVSSPFSMSHILCFSTEHLRVPVLVASSYGVIENEDDVVLTCYTNEKFPHWFLNDMNLNLTNQMRMSMDGRRLTINPVRREDAGVYKCEVWNPIMWVESRPLELHVLY